MKLPGRLKQRDTAMSHKEAAALVPQYLSGALEGNRLISFLEHVYDCSECYEELETMFMVQRAVQYLDSDEDAVFDLAPLLESDIQTRLKAEQRRRLTLRVRLAVAGVSAAAFILALLDAFGLAALTRLPV